MSDESGKVGSQKRVFRCRNITSCKRCFQSKRKCSKAKPSCERCLRIKSPCVYFTEDQLENRKKSRRDDAFSDIHDVPNTEITPQPRSKENYNFKLIVNSTGEYSKYFPMSLFPFYEHSSNVSWVVDSKKNVSQTVAIFDFNVMFKHFSSLNQIKEYIPERKICDIFVYHFFQNVYPIIPIVDREEFDIKYRNYWADPSGFDDMNSLILLFAILFCSTTSLLINAAVSQDKTSPLLNYQLMRIDFFNCIENLKYMLNANVTPSLSTLTSLALIYYVGSMNGFPVTVQISVLSKMAQIFGLHRKITQKLDTTPLRDVVYCFIWFLDSMSTYYTGLPTNMYSRSFESESLFPTKSKDVLSLFFLGRLHNAKTWSSILDKINQIEICSIDEYHELDELFSQSVVKVNSISQEILNTRDTPSDYLKWMATETRMGLSKSSILMSVLRHSLSYVPNENLINKLTTDLVLQSLILINESILKLLIGRRALPTCMWYNRLCFPFQAMYVVLSHIKQYPSHTLNLSQLESKYEFTIDPAIEVNVLEGDIRMSIVDRCIEVLKILEPVWTPVTNDRFHRIQKFRFYVSDQVANNPYPSTKVSPPSAYPSMDTPSTSAAGGTPRVIKPEPNTEPDLSAYTFLDDGLQFMFGEDFMNKGINAIVSDMDTLYNSLS